MKKGFYLSTVILLIALTVRAQDNASGRGGTIYTSFSDFNPKKDFYCGYDKVIKKTDKAGIVSGSIHFKDITKGGVLLGKGQGRENVISWAILQGVTDRTRKEISEEFAKMINTKLQAAGIEMVDYSNFKSSKNFEKLQAMSDDKMRSAQNLGRLYIETAYDAPYTKFNPLKTPGVMAKLSKDAGANAITYDIVVDFARFDIQAERWRTKNYGIGYDMINTKTSADVMPQISIATTTGGDQTNQIATNIFIYNDKKLGSQISLSKNLFYMENYATEVDSYEGEMPAEIKKGLTMNTRTTGTFVIKADEQKYKEVVLKALDRFADLLVKEYIAKEIRG